ncbi:MAG TPA: DUF86 domain-containing protein [Sulfuricurvum sp.]|nr:DUF86 domain-containing protein [Sulfuricurvum sp.]
MFSTKALERIKTIIKKIEFIQAIIDEYGGTDKALEDEQYGRAAILMHLTSIGEQFDKLLHNGDLDVLAFFEKEDIKGSYNLRNFIAHDYEGIDLYIVEDVIDKRLPIILENAKEVLEQT